MSPHRPLHLISSNDLNVAIANQFKKQINGQFKRMSYDLTSIREEQRSQKVMKMQTDTVLNKLSDDFKLHVDIVQPIIEDFRDRRGLWNILRKLRENWLIVAGLAGAVSVILAIIIKLIQWPI